MSNYSSHTTEELQEITNARRALDEKRPVEQMHSEQTNGKWVPFRGNFYVNGYWRYRPAPTPEVIPWTRETLPPLPVEVVSKASGNRYSVIGVLADFVSLGHFGLASYDMLQRDFARPNGSPCGEVKA